MLTSPAVPLAEGPQRTCRQAELADEPFITNSNCALAKESEDILLDRTLIAKGVKAVLHDASKGRYFILEEKGACAAQLMITYEWSDWRNGACWWIQSVYVGRQYRRKGLFRHLYQHVAGMAKAEGAVGLRLYVDEHNNGAMCTYEALGMTSHYKVYEDMF